MLRLAAIWICKILFKHGDPLEKDEEVYLYGMECLLADILQVAVICIIATVSHEALEVAVFCLFFTTLKRNTGGYHAPNHFICIVSFSSVAILNTIIVGWIPEQWIMPIIVAALFLTLICVFLKAPVEGLVNPKSTEEMIESRKKSIIVALLQVAYIICGTRLFKDFAALWLSGALGGLAVSVTLMMPVSNKERRKSEHVDSNETENEHKNARWRRKSCR